MAGISDTLERKQAILSYCATFLPREMLHVHRQVAGIQKFENWVVTRRREHEDRFPYPRVVVLRKSPLRAFTRLFYRSRRQMVPLGRTETRQLLALVRGKNAALAHLYLGSEALRALAFLEQCPAARVVSFHGADLSDEYPAEWYRRLWPQAELVLCRSDSLRDLLLRKGCPPEKIRLNNTGVPLPATEKPKTLAKLSPKEPLRLLQACRFIGKKGLDVSLTAVRQLKDRGLAVKLTLAGEGPEEAPLRKLAEELGIAGEVSFAGFLNEEQLHRCFETHDIFIHPSRTTASGDQEGIPNALLEAMAWGMPVVSTRHSGIPEAVTDGESGVLIDSAEPQLLSAAIARVAGDSAFFASLSRQAAASIRDRFSVARCVENLEALYTEAIHTAAKRR